jgi:hypothetical protein
LISQWITNIPENYPKSLPLVAPLQGYVFQDQMGATIQGFTDRSDTMVEFSTLGNILIGQGSVINAQRGNVINNITMCQDTSFSMPLSIHTSQELTTAL